MRPYQISRVYSEGLVVLLAGAASAAFTTLIDTIVELRRTREELARTAVLDERQRFSRDLHDLLGHTLSVMVVKAQAVRRLAPRDADAAVEHATDIERIGRRAGRRAPGRRRDAGTDARRGLDGAQRALDAAGICTTIDRSVGPVSETVEHVLGWVVREGATNVLRHSGAGSCRIALVERDGHVELSIADDGVGMPTPRRCAPADWTGCGTGWWRPAAGSTCGRRRGSGWSPVSPPPR